MQLSEEQIIEWLNLAYPGHTRRDFEVAKAAITFAAHNAGAQEPVVTIRRDGSMFRTQWHHEMPESFELHLYAKPISHPQPMTDAARDAQDAKRYRFLRSQMRIGAVQTQLPLYRTLHWIGYEDCNDVRNADEAIDAEIDRLDRAKGE